MADNVVLERITSDEPIATDQYIVNNINSFSLNDSSYAGIQKFGISLRNVERFLIRNTDFKNQKISEHGISMAWDEQECPRLNVLWVFENLSHLAFEEKAIHFVNSCRPRLNRNEGKLQFKLIMQNCNFSPILPKKMLQYLLIRADESRNNTLVRLVSDDIDCCHADNKWLFELQDRQNGTGNEYRITCKDIGKSVHEYSLWSLESTCNAMPKYVIAAISLVAAVAILTALCCACYFYVIRKRRARAPLSDPEQREIEGNREANVIESLGDAIKLAGASQAKEPAEASAPQTTNKLTLSSNSHSGNKSSAISTHSSRRASHKSRSRSKSSSRKHASSRGSSRSSASSLSRISYGGKRAPSRHRRASNVESNVKSNVSKIRSSRSGLSSRAQAAKTIIAKTNSSKPN